MESLDFLYPLRKVEGFAEGRKQTAPPPKEPRQQSRWDAVLTTCTVAATIAIVFVAVNLFEKIQQEGHKVGAPPSHSPVAEHRETEGGFCGMPAKKAASRRAPILADFALPICVDPDL